MIKCTEQYNIKCLVCKKVPRKLIRVGAYHMCPGCFSGIFGDDIEEIEPTSILGDIYYKWLKVYKEVP
jgi:hypothetical protein